MLMLSFSRNTTMTGCRNALSSLSCSRQRFAQHHSHALQRRPSTRCQTLSKMIHFIQYSNKATIQRHVSNGSGKRPKSKPKSMIRVERFGTKDFMSATLEWSFSEFWKSFLQPKPMPVRWSIAWYQEMALICTVFAITGSSTMVLVRPAVSKGLGLQGSFKDGPWSFRICSLVVMTPIYATLLLVVGTAFGRHAYFRHFSVKMWTRFGIPPELIDKSWHKTKNFRKW